MLDTSRLGERVRDIRKKKLMTIKVLSQYTGLSVGYLSTFEQNKTTPTIDNLAKICEALEVSITDVLQMKGTGSAVIRKDEIKEELHPEENMSVGIIDFKQNNCVLEYIRIKPGDDIKKQYYRHVLDEMGTVLTGVLTIEIEDKTYELYPGDSVFVKGGERHCIYNKGTDEIMSVWVYQRSTDKLL